MTTRRSFAFATAAAGPVDIGYGRTGSRATRTAAAAMEVMVVTEAMSRTASPTGSIHATATTVAGMAAATTAVGPRSAGQGASTTRWRSAFRGVGWTSAS